MARAIGLIGWQGHYGPDHPAGDDVDESFIPVPNEQADKLAGLLSRRALRAFATVPPPELPSLQVELLAEPARPELIGTRLRVARCRASFPDDVDDHARTIGLPLLLSLAPHLQRPAAQLVFERRLPNAAGNRAANRELGMHVVALESHLWQLAFAAGGPVRNLPYATRLRALRWWWEPSEGRTPRVTLCIRCGDLTLTRSQRNGPPFCTHCEDDRRLEHPRAIAPGERGTWWIRCQEPGCSNAFAARLQARKCPDHKTSRLTPSRRRPNDPDPVTHDAT